MSAWTLLGASWSALCFQVAPLFPDAKKCQCMQLVLLKLKSQTKNDKLLWQLTTESKPTKYRKDWLTNEKQVKESTLEKDKGRKFNETDYK